MECPKYPSCDLLVYSCITEFCISPPILQLFPIEVLEYILAPFIFDSKGDIVNFRALSYEQLPHAYLEQLQYTDIKIQEIVEKLLDSEPKPIIIIQSDHGVRFQLNEKDEQPLKHAFLNFEAYYFPGVELDKDEYPVITPANSFRILFNKYFGTDYELLENHAFLEKDGKFSDVTDFVISNRIFPLSTLKVGVP